MKSPFWHPVAIRPIDRADVWLWWPGLRRPVLGESVWTKHGDLFRTDDLGSVEGLATHWAHVEWPKNPQHLDSTTGE